MFQMNEEEFAKIEEGCYWFTFPLFEEVPEVFPAPSGVNGLALCDDAYVQRYLFCLIFGGFGIERDLQKAKIIATTRLFQVEKTKPRDTSTSNPKFLEWIQLFAKYNILLGTVFAYLGNYSIAAYLLLSGLKTRALNLFLPYCDFIAYILSRVEEIPAEDAEYEGCGFSADLPMGGTDPDRGDLISNMAELVISGLEGDDGEIVLAHRGSHSYGSITRLGSTASEKHRNCIDMYEVLVAKRDFTVKRVRFYFNGYFTRGNRSEVRLPRGFHLDPMSIAAEMLTPVR